MSLTLERDLNPTCRSQVTKAKAAATQKNYDYAITLLQAVLKDYPLYLEGRQRLRAAEIEKFKSLGKIAQQMAGMRLSGGMMKLSSSKKSPQDLLIQAEEILANDPFNAKANALIGEAATGLACPELKIFAYETLRTGKPEDKPTLNSLALAYMENKEPAKAIKVYENIITVDPSDGDALSGLKNAHAANASKSGGWETAEGDYRNVLKSKAEAQQLEQEGKVVKSADAIDEQIAVNFAKHEAEPNSPVHSKSIAQLFVQKNDYASAIPWFQHSYEAGGKIDSSLEKTIGDLRLKSADQQLQALHATLAEQTDPEQQAQTQAAIDRQEKELNDVRLFLAEARVRAQPNEGGFRFDLGEALYKVGEYKRATEELQQSLKQPSVRYQALNLLGLCFMKRGMTDFAINRLSLAESELPGMDEVKKEITYNLGLSYEANKQPDKSLEQWKKIYEVDMSYRDVAQRVEDSYGTGEAPAA
jgi:tetratricopeptide (TPR) repeat protein